MIAGSGTVISTESSYTKTKSRKEHEKYIFFNIDKRLRINPDIFSRSRSHGMGYCLKKILTKRGTDIDSKDHMSLEFHIFLVMKIDLKYFLKTHFHETILSFGEKEKLLCNW